MNCHNCNCLIGAFFYTTPNIQGVWEIFCEKCYPQQIDGSSDNISNPVKNCVPNCECGAGTPMGQSHSKWCPIYRSEF